MFKPKEVLKIAKAEEIPEEATDKADEPIDMGKLSCPNCGDPMTIGCITPSSDGKMIMLTVCCEACMGAFGQIETKVLGRVMVDRKGTKLKDL